MCRSDTPDGSKIWSVRGREDKPGSVLVDFSPKGGPKDLAGASAVITSTATSISSTTSTITILVD